MPVRAVVAAALTLVAIALVLVGAFTLSFSGGLIALGVVLAYVAVMVDV